MVQNTLTDRKLKKLKEHKMFNRTDKNITSLIEVLNIRIAEFRKKMSKICSEMNKLTGEVKTLNKILEYRKQNNISVSDNFYYPSDLKR